MKKFLLTLSLIVAGVSLQAASASYVIPANTMTNIVPNGSYRIKQFILASTNATAVAVQAYDQTTNSLTRVNPSYTNYTSVITNYTDLYTNYYGLVQTNWYTNVLYTFTNQAVASATVSLQPTLSASAPANTAVIYDGVNYMFYTGIWVTNGAATAATVTITYEK